MLNLFLTFSKFQNGHLNQKWPYFNIFWWSFSQFRSFRGHWIVWIGQITHILNNWNHFNSVVYTYCGIFMNTIIQMTVYLNSKHYILTGLTIGYWRQQRQVPYQTRIIWLWLNNILKKKGEGSIIQVRYVTTQVAHHRYNTWAMEQVLKQVYPKLLLTNPYLNATVLGVLPKEWEHCHCKSCAYAPNRSLEYPAFLESLSEALHLRTL